MKRSIVILLLCFLLTSCVDAKHDDVFVNEGVEITGNSIEGSTDCINQNTGLLRKDDALYYVYNKDTITMKVVKISADGIQDIYTVPPSPLSVEGMVGAPAIRLYEEQIIAVEDGNIIQYDSQTDLWHINEELTNIPYLYTDFYCLNDAVVYTYVEQDPDDEFTYRHYVGCYSDGALKSYDNDVDYYWDGESTDSVEYYPERQFVCTDGESLYYTQWILHPNEQQQTEIRRYHTADQTDELLFQTEMYSATDFLEYILLCASEEYIIFESRFSEDAAPYKIFSMNTNSQATPTLIFSSNEDVAVSGVYKDSVYLATPQGVIRYNLVEDEETVLSDRYANMCYILDDTWVYFVSNDASLWRVAQDGSVTEHVYG